VVSRVLAELKSSSLPLSGQKQTAALIYTRALLLSGEDAPKMVASLAGQVDKELLPVFAAATSLAVGVSEGPVFNSLSEAAGADGAKGIGSAASDPSSVMDADSIMLVQALVIELRGVAAPVIPPPATSPMNLVPPIVPEGRTASQPPVANVYENQ
jgi:hypothetical protein